MRRGDRRRRHGGGGNWSCSECEGGEGKELGRGGVKGGTDGRNRVAAAGDGRRGDGREHVRRQAHLLGPCNDHRHKHGMRAGESRDIGVRDGGGVDSEGWGGRRGGGGCGHGGGRLGRSSTGVGGGGRRGRGGGGGGGRGGDGGGSSGRVWRFLDLDIPAVLAPLLGRGLMCGRVRAARGRCWGRVGRVCVLGVACLRTTGLGVAGGAAVSG